MSDARIAPILVCLLGVLAGLHACTAIDGTAGRTGVIDRDPFARFQADRTIEQGGPVAFDEGGSTFRVAAIPGKTRLLAVYDSGQNRPHTVRIDTNLLDLRDHAALAESLSIIADAVEPNDEKVRLWMLDAYARAWARHRIVADDASRTPEDLIVEWPHLGLWYSTFGIPPDIAMIVVTSRDPCRPRNQINRLYRDWHRYCH